MVFFLSSSSREIFSARAELYGVMDTCEKFTVLAAHSPHGVLVPGLVEIFGAGLGVGGRIGILFGNLFLSILSDNFFDPSLHHAKILLGVDVLCLSLGLHILHLPDIPLCFFIAFDAIVDAGGRSWWFGEQVLEM